MFPVLPKDQEVSPGSSELRTMGDFALVNRLLANPRYKIPEHLRDKVVNQIENVLDDPESKNVLKLRAIDTLTKLDKQNLELIKLSMPKKVEHFDPKKMNDEKLLETVQEVLKLLPRTLND